MKDYYLLIGLNKKEVKIKNIEQKKNGLIEVSKTISRWKEYIY